MTRRDAPIAFPSPLAIVLLFLATVLCALPAAQLLAAGWFWSAMPAGQLLGFGVPIALAVARWPDLRRDAFRVGAWHWRTAGLVIVATILIATLTHTSVEWIKTTFTPPPLFEDLYAVQLQATNWWEGLRLIALVALIPALLEETFFRGICFTSLSRHSGHIIGWIGSSLLFALAHGHWHFFPLYLGLGLYLGALRWRTNGLWAPILAHALNNVWTLWLLRPS